MTKTIILTKEIAGNLSTNNLNEEILRKENLGFTVTNTVITNGAIGSNSSVQLYPTIMVTMQKNIT